MSNSKLPRREGPSGDNTRIKCALVVGHKKSSPGAGNVGSGLTEFDFNDQLARMIDSGNGNTIIQRIYRRTYKSLPDDINACEPDFIISLHCNAYNTEASGTEVLYYHKSRDGEACAGILQRTLVGYLNLRDRGPKPKKAEDRGGYLLKYTNATCLISEPFFIDNDSDLARASQDLDGLAGAYIDAIDKIAAYIDELRKALT